MLRVRDNLGGACADDKILSLLGLCPWCPFFFGADGREGRGGDRREGRRNWVRVSSVVQRGDCESQIC